MKVLKKGKWTSFQICPECDAELLLHVIDVKCHPDSQNVNDNEYFYYDCPECECRHKLDAKELPDEVRKAAYAVLHEAHPRPPVVFK